jgi:hypothetical protein
MGIGNELHSLKQNALAAKEAAFDRQHRGAGLFLLSWFSAFILLLVGFGYVMSGVVALAGSSRIGGDTNPVILFGIGVVAFAVGIFLFHLPSIVTSKDKERQRLTEVASTATEGYSHTLMAELATYGIDTESRSDRTDFMDADYEFTALRNGDPVDITVRDFNHEVVFMLNGERLQKTVTV